MKWPSGAQVLELEYSTNKHWKKGDIVELLSVEPECGKLSPSISDYHVIHHCGAGYSHVGYMFDATVGLRPLTDTARAMLAIAREGK